MPCLQRSHARIYNGLPDVLVASNELSAGNKTEVLDTLCKVILKHRLENTVGIRLLHRHNDIAQQELMLESEERDAEGRYCLSTVAVAQDGTLAAPNSWMLGEDGFQPLEFSLDPFVLAESGLTVREKEFYHEFGDTLKSLNVAGLLGPCIINRSFFDKRRPEDSSMLSLIETTDDQRRANVLRFDDESKYKPEQLIETTWMATRPEEEGVTFKCTVGKCTASCAVIIHCDANEDGSHTSSSRHGQALHWKEHTSTPVPDDFA